jgi:hypothetical protein
MFHILACELECKIWCMAEAQDAPIRHDTKQEHLSEGLSTCTSAKSPGDFSDLYEIILMCLIEFE